MKHNSWLHTLLGFLFAAVLSIAAIGNPISGWKLPSDSLQLLFVGCFLWALISVLLLRLRYGTLFLSALTLLAVRCLWQDGLLWEQVQSLAFLISAHYNDIYGWPTIGTPLTTSYALPLLFIGTWAGACVSYCFCRGRHLALLIPPVILPLVLCLITTDRAPAPQYLYLLMLSVLLLLCSDWTRRRNPVQGDRLILRLTLPLGICLALLFAANPQQSYVNRANQLGEMAVSFFEQLQKNPEPTIHISPIDPVSGEKLNLKTVGPKTERTTYRMEVESTVDWVFYLRGRDYEVYTGTGWESSADRIESFGYSNSPSGEITVTTYGMGDVLYVPYYPCEPLIFEDGAVENGDRLRFYTFPFSASVPRGLSAPSSACTELPADTMAWAAPLAAEVISDETDDSVAAQLIARYVRDSASYDLSTARMPQGHDDFARWFLEESDTGYCVHFASAATVLLRGAGIPARYVEGYMVTCKAQEITRVSNHNAHAWVEYYDRSMGAWKILEPTPPDPDREEPTEPPVTTAPPIPNTAPPILLQPTEPDSVPTDPQATPATESTKPVTRPTEIPSQTPDIQITPPEWTDDLIWLLFAFSLLPLQCFLRIRWKQKRRNSGDANQRAMVLWRESVFTARVLGVSYPEELNQLAQKAAFSQHQLRPEELEQFRSFQTQLADHLRQKPWYQRIPLQWFLAMELC